jgi:hypothetical protein
MPHTFPKWTSALLFLALSSAAFAQDAGPVVAVKHPLAKAVQVQVTLRGQKYFESNLFSLLENQGYNFSEGYFPKQTIFSDKPIDIKELEKANPEAYKMYIMGKDLLTKWFVGFTLADHKPAIEIGDSGYQASFSKFALVTDEALMKTLGKKDGAVMAIDLQISKLSVATKSARIWDQNNFSFAKAGMDDISLLAGDEKTPLKIRLPFYIRVNDKGAIEFQTLDMTENLQEVPLAVKYKNLVVPQIAIEIDGHKYALNTNQLKSYVDEQLPTILTQIRKYLSEFAHKQLPDILNKKAKESMAGALEQVQTMAAPGQTSNDPRPRLLWGLQLASIGLQNSLNLALNAYAEDPINPNVGLAPNTASRGLPKINALSPDKYDIALSIDRGMINRLLQLSFLRKNFDAIRDDDGTVLKLTQAPTVDYVSPPAAPTDKEAYVKLHVSIETQPNQPLWLEKTIIISFDMIAKMQPTGQPGKMTMLKQMIDVESLEMDRGYLTGPGKIAEALGHQVTKGIKKELFRRSQNWIRNGAKLTADDMDLPPQLYGMVLDVTKLSMDPNGHLVMYLNYNTGVKK